LGERRRDDECRADEQVAFARELRRKAELFVDENWAAIRAVAER